MAPRSKETCWKNRFLAIVHSDRFKLALAQCKLQEVKRAKQELEAENEALKQNNEALTLFAVNRLSEF